MNIKLWDELDNISEEIKAKFDDTPYFPLNSAIKFVRSYNAIKIGTKALIVDRDHDYYALTINGKYVEGIHKEFLGQVD
jgi:hypothetical protein